MLSSYLEKVQVNVFFFSTQSDYILTRKFAISTHSAPQPPPTLARGSLARPALGETWGASERRGGSGGGQCKIFSKREKFAKREKFKKQHYANGQTWIVHGIDGAGGRPRFLP